LAELQRQQQLIKAERAEAEVTWHPYDARGRGRWSLTVSVCVWCLC
jgi:hypothetical protein